MRAMLAIARAEFVRNWKLVFVPLFAVFGVFALAALGTHVSDRSFRGNLMGILILFEFPLAAVPAAVLGLNLFGPDIRQRKLGFFLTRPCAPWQLYLGRLVGASAIISVGWFGAAVILPFMGATGSTTGSGIVKSVDGLIFAAGLFGLLLAMNAMAMIFAANSARWFIADIVAALAFVAAVVWSLGQALRLGDPRYVTDVFYATALGLVVALFFGGLAFLSAGRGDGQSGHRAHSLTLWTFGLVIILGLGGQRGYEWSRPLASLFRFGHVMSAGPSQVVVSTYGRRHSASFLLDTRTGLSRRISVFAAGGSRDLKSGRLGFVEPHVDPTAPGFRAEYLVISSLDSQFRTVVERPAPAGFKNQLLAIGENGRFAMFGDPNEIDVLNTETGESRFRYAAPSVKWAVFQRDSTIAVVSGGSAGTARLSTLALDGKVLQERQFPVSAPFWYMKVHSDSGRVVVTEGEYGATLYERDGTVLVHLAPDPHPPQTWSPGRGNFWPGDAQFTRSGDFLRTGATGVSVMRHGETAMRDLPLTDDGHEVAPGRRRIIGELESGEIVMVESEKSPDGLPYVSLQSSLLVDPLTGVVRLRLKRLRPIVRMNFGGATSLSSPSEDSALRLFTNDDGDILFLDLGSKTPRVVVKSTIEDR